MIGKRWPASSRRSRRVPASPVTPAKRRAPSAALAIAATLAGSFLLASDEPGGSAGASSDAARGGVVVLRVDSIIHPVAHEYVADGLEEAESSKADVVVIEIDTPGGLLDSTHEITTAMLGTDLPVVVFVAPQRRARRFGGVLHPDGGRRRRDGAGHQHRRSSSGRRSAATTSREPSARRPKRTLPPTSARSRRATGAMRSSPSRR